MGIGHDSIARGPLGLPLIGARRALGQLPLVAEQGFQVAVVPFGRRWRPGTLQAAGDGVAGLATAECVLPAQAHFGDIGRLGLRTDIGRIACTVALAEGMAAHGKGDGFFIVHRHAGEGFAHIATGRHWVGIAVRTLRVHIDKAHLHRSQRTFQLAVTGVAAVGLVAGGQPFMLGAPIDVLFRFVDVHAAATEAEGLEAHGLQRDVAGEDHQVAPGQLVAVLLLDRPEQAACLVEVAVVRPAVEGSETLVAGTGTTTPVRDAVGTRGVPGHADEQRTVMAVVRRPPVLGVGHQGGEVLDHCVEVKGLEGFGIVELSSQWVGFGRMLMKDLEVELVGPPLRIRWHDTGDHILP
ncbi:hypothetical protein D9M72_358110 [compost metagenome]